MPGNLEVRYFLAGDNFLRFSMFQMKKIFKNSMIINITFRKVYIFTPDKKGNAECFTIARHSFKGFADCTG